MEMLGTYSVSGNAVRSTVRALTSSNTIICLGSDSTVEKASLTSFYRRFLRCKIALSVATNTVQRPIVVSRHKFAV